MGNFKSRGSSGLAAIIELMGQYKFSEDVRSIE
jgi:hypothetical protein